MIVYEEENMPIAKISKEGLAAMAVAVGLLWGCIGLERVRARRADSEYRLTLRKMHKLRLRSSRPASAHPRNPAETNWREASL